MTTVVTVSTGVGTQYGRLSAYDRAAAVFITGLASEFYGEAVTGELTTADGATALAPIATGTVSAAGAVTLTFDLDTAAMATLMAGRTEDADTVLTVYATGTESNACVATLKLRQAADHGTTTTATDATPASLLEAQALVDAHIADATAAHAASAVSVAATPENYIAATADVEAHLAGIDDALASSGGGGGVSWPTADGPALADANRFAVGQLSGAAWTWVAKTGTQVKAWLKTWADGLYAAITHAAAHAAGGADPVTLAAIEPTIDAAVPSTAGAGNMLVTEADLAGLGGGGGLEVVHVVAATLTPESGKHYVCANDVQILAPTTPTGSILWECSIYLEAGVMLTYPTGWLVSGAADATAANRARISYASGAQWNIDWEAKYETVSGDVIFVSTTGDDANDGRSWATAYRTVHKAFAEATSGQQVWIAAGTYDAATTNGYALPSGVTVYGGFAGTEASTAERAYTPDADGIGASVYDHETVLSNRTDITADAAWVCFANLAPGVGDPCTLNGLTIGPSRQGVYCTTSGAAVLVDCRVTGCVYAGATADGGGLVNATASACTVLGCSAGRNGGGSYQGTLTNCVLSDNSASSYGGGSYQGTLTNCVLSGNSAANGGGSCQSTLTNCVLSGNSAGNGGGSYQSTLINCLVLHNAPSGAGTSLLSTVTQRNCILWRNTGTVSGTATDTIDDASLTLAAFVDPLDIPAGLAADEAALLATIEAGGYDVAAGSPVIDAGADSYNTTVYDLLGRTRKVSTIDIGPYEYQG